MLNILIFLLILTVLILIHELGHFLVAKKLGVKVEEFGLGFPPRMFDVKIGETMYSINWILFGGFVRLYGEDGKVVAGKKKGRETLRSYAHKSALGRASIVVAGVIMNLILAVALFYALLAASNFQAKLPLLTDHTFRFVTQTNPAHVLVSAVAEDSPAKFSGLRPMSRIVSLDDTPFTGDSPAFKEYIDQRRGKEVTLGLEDLTTKEQYEVKAVPRVSPPESQGALGVAIDEFKEANLSYDRPLMKIFSGPIHTLNMAEYNLGLLGTVLSISIERKTAEPFSNAVGGPVAIGSIVSDVLNIPNVRERALTLLNITAIISLSLAIMNVLPIPAIDGGRLFFIFIETITRRRIDPTIERRINTIGFILLMTLMLIITYRDLLRFVFIR